MKSDVNIFKGIITVASCVGVFPLRGGRIKKVFHFIIITGIEIVLSIIRLNFCRRNSEAIFSSAHLMSQTLTTFIFQFICVLGMIYDSDRLCILFKILNKLDAKFKNIGKKSLQMYLPPFLFLITTGLDSAFLMYGYSILFNMYIFELLIIIQLSSLLSTICQFCYILCVKYNTLNAILNDTFVNKKYELFTMYTKIKEVGYYLSLLNKAACIFNVVTGKRNLVLLIMTFGNILSTFYTIMSTFGHSYQTSLILIFYYRLIMTLVSTYNLFQNS